MKGPNSTSPLSVSSLESGRARDHEIVSALRAGCPDAFAELHAIYAGRLYRTILAITRNAEDAEDVLQETFLRAYLRIGTFEERSGVYSWLTRIAINSALMKLRRGRARPEVPVDPSNDGDAEAVCFDVRDPAPNPEEICDQHHRQLSVLRAIRDLHPHLQEPIRMRMTRGWSAEQIGEALNLSVAAVKTRLYRARLRLSVVCATPKCAAGRRRSALAPARNSSGPRNRCRAALDDLLA
jgi:RNA polymerase sigma-70 factor, ECF subfamily